GAVLAQQGVELAEVVVVDEGSSDGTAELLASIADPRLRVVRHDSPVGLAGARNAGLSCVRAPWVAFCDDDDLWAPDKLASQLEAVGAVPGARWSCVTAVHIDEADRVVGFHDAPTTTEPLDALLARCVVPGGGSGVLVETRLLRELGGFDEDLSPVADWDLAIRLALAAPLAPVDRPLLGYRVWSASMSHDTGRMDRATVALFANHRALAAVRRGPADEVVRARYRGRQGARAGRRSAAAHFLRAAWTGGGGRDVVAAGLVAVAPRSFAGCQARRVPAPVRQEAEQWLRRVAAVTPGHRTDGRRQVVSGHG
ncbi:MAG: glycosyltransferase, partial [Acidimicrobiia bacterium]